MVTHACFMVPPAALSPPQGGFGDYIPTSHLEGLSAMAFVFVNYWILVFVIGVMSNVVNALDEPVRAFHNQFNALQLYLDSHELPEDMCNDLRVFTRLKFDSRDEHVEILETFPPILRAKLFRVMYRPIIESAYILDQVPDTFVDVLSCALQVEMIQGGMCAREGIGVVVRLVARCVFCSDVHFFENPSPPLTRVPLCCCFVSSSSAADRYCPAAAP